MRPSSFQGNVHIINFPAGTAAADLAALFDDFGIVMGAQIKSIPSTGGNLRLGIVSVAPDKAADKAIEALQGYQMGGQKLKLVRPKPQPQPAPKPRQARTERPRPQPQPPIQAQPQSQSRRIEEYHAAQSPAGERYPAMAQMEPPRKVIVEYKKNRSLSRLSG